MKSNSDEIVKRKLESFEVDPPVGSWDAIQQGLPAQKRGANVVLWRRAAVAAAFIAAVTTSAFWFLGKSPQPKLAKTDSVEFIYPKSEPIHLDSSAQQHVIMPNKMIAKAEVAATPKSNDLVSENKSSIAPPKKGARNESASGLIVPQKNDGSQEIATAAVVNDPTTAVVVEKRATAEELADFERAGQTTDEQDLEKSIKENKASSLGLLAALPGTSNTTVNSARSLRSATTTQDAVAILNASQTSAQNAGYTQHYYIPLSAALLFNKEISSRLSIETGLRYTYLMSTQQQGSAPYYSTLTQRLHYLGVPLNLNYRILRSNRFSLYTKTGLLVEKNIAGKWNEEIKNADGTTVYDEQFRELEKVPQWSVNVGVGAQYGINKWLNFYFEPATAYYFENGSSIDNVRKHHRFDFSLQAGFRVGL